MELVSSGMHFIATISHEDAPPNSIICWGIIGGIVFVALVCLECFYRFRNRRVRRVSRSDVEDSEEENEQYSPLRQAPAYPYFEHSQPLMADYSQRRAGRGHFEEHEISELERTFEAPTAGFELPPSPSRRKRSSPIPISQRRRNYSGSHPDDYFDYLSESTDGERSPFPSGCSLGDSSDDRMLNPTAYKNIPQPKYGYSSMSTLSADDHVMPQQAAEKDPPSTAPNLSLDCKSESSSVPDADPEPESPEPKDLFLLERSTASE